jgi:hypothetical protein
LPIFAIFSRDFNLASAKNSRMQYPLPKLTGATMDEQLRNLAWLVKLRCTLRAAELDEILAYFFVG